MNNNDTDNDKENVATGNIENLKDSIKFKVRKSPTLPEKTPLKKVQLQYDQTLYQIAKIQKEIKFLNNLLPPFNVEVDYRTRNKIANAIGKLEAKSDELEKKKYNLGITLSRLWRDVDDSDIWIRTVSS